MKRIYLAGGWFTSEQAEEHERIYNLLKDNFEVFNPKLESLITSVSTDNDMTNTLLGNIKGIEKADIVVAIYDGKDTGTIWETGYAYAINKPIIYYAEKLFGKPFNLMLAKTGNFAKNESELVKMLNNESIYQFKPIYSSYKGDIE